MRREFLRVGLAGGIGLSLGDSVAGRALTSDATKAGSVGGGPPADAVIQVFLAGGLSHIDTFDPKPDAPIEIRGELGIVKTATGEIFSGLCRQTAAIADKIAVIRSVTHDDAAHERGSHAMLTGYRSSRGIVHPTMGAVAAERLCGRRNVPPYVCVPSKDGGYLGTGHLSSAFGTFDLGTDPADAGFALRDCSPALGGGDTETRGRLNLADEDARIREEYGCSDIGWRLLTARRLVEAGARFVTVEYGGWDHHHTVRDGMRSRFPAVDRAFAALIRDLERRGLLDRTLVVLSTEFGRTPCINKDAGRDHWSKAFSIVIAGGGVKGGRIVGRTDRFGAEPVDQPVRPADMAATLFARIGVDPRRQWTGQSDQPAGIVRQGKIIAGLT